MRIIFAGTPEFAVPSLRALIDSDNEVIAVYTQPDRPAGRGQKLTASPVKSLALQHKLPVYQPTTLRDFQEQQRLQQLHPDLMVVVAYGMLLPSAVLVIPRLECINIHPSLLPRWRGAAPIQRAILSGDTVTGVTIMQMEEGLDSGPMLLKIKCPIESTDTSATLHDKLSKIGSKALLDVIAQLDFPFAEDQHAKGEGILHREIQNPNEACYAKKISKEEAEINWDLYAGELDRQIRAFNPWPVAYTFLQDQIIKIWQAIPLDETHQKNPGTIIRSNKNGIDVATGLGILRLMQLQLPGGRCLPVADILNAKAEMFASGLKLGK